MGSPSSGCPFFVRSTFTVTPLGSTGISRFLATMGVSDFRPEPCERLCIHARRSARHTLRWDGPLRRLSQVPRPFFPCAPLPLTPGRPTYARARCFYAGCRLRHIRQVGRDHMCNEAETDLLALRLARLLPRLRRYGLSPSAAGTLHVERAIYVAGTFHPARKARLVLAHRMTRMGAGA